MNDEYLKNMKKLEEQEKANKCNICGNTGWETFVDKEGYEVAKKCRCGRLQRKDNQKEE